MDDVWAYTSNYKKAKEYDVMHHIRKEKREELKNSDMKLRTLYERIKDKYFESNYLPKGEKVIFVWRRADTAGGRCSKTQKRIRMGGAYKEAFTSRLDHQLKNGYFSTQLALRHSLVRLMIHEAIHLRLAHHRKSFKLKEAEIEDKVQQNDIPSLFEELIH